MNQWVIEQYRGRDDAGMPFGVQVVGSFGDDARLLRTARWLENIVED